MSKADLNLKNAYNLTKRKKVKATSMTLIQLHLINSNNTGSLSSSNSATIPAVILGLIISGDFFISAIAARGIPQLATGPQKC